MFEFDIGDMIVPSKGPFCIVNNDGSDSNDINETYHFIVVEINITINDKEYILYDQINEKFSSWSEEDLSACFRGF